ncbi:MAG: glutathione S-transferase family protein [Alphaproteobacteria bacterium]|nr:glutathione S-transferase family protein [Alphaproteobacteria bacterium]
MPFMRTLVHFALSPFCRKVRLALAEKRIEFELRAEKPWEQRPEFLELSPAGTVPVLIEDNGLVIPNSTVICEYLEEAYGAVPLLPKPAAERAEVRRLTQWFDEVFHRDVTVRLLYEKVHKRFATANPHPIPPDMALIREGLAAVREHLEALCRLLEVRHWLAGDMLTLADFAAAAHFSSIDYLGDIPWNQYGAAKEWYVRLKSRPSFRPLLGDMIPGMAPVRYYTNLDF